MKTGIFLGLILFLVPFQATVLGSISPFGIRPDLCLIAACLMGFFTGQIQGFVLGFFLGFVQDLFSASDLWLNTITKSGVGFFAGLIARNLANTASHSAFLLMVAFSLFSGVIFLMTSRGGLDLVELLQGFPAVLLPQALFDGLVAVGLYWVITRWTPEFSSV
ncbi:rod shape-determining protein MreD [Candidatus Nitronereus thalassa]|uniref:Rod shape-determining protein MreD n=1 Tax=Candidatus Nitronereus thalassa TaxID=3020898 RepID=A0ABU3K8C5_9BACT|nr:rod shape-determining protein MreD [Candidatus Nitronereus thalassa]MDT7042607.1 rod shape-determining protein MreD [Candidatus Nitronereus thalassa]